VRPGPTLLGALAPRRIRLAYRHVFWRAQGGIPTSTTDAERRELRALAAGRDVLELGSQYGATTAALASEARIVFAVDHHLGDPIAGEWDTLGDFVAELERRGLRRRVVVVVGRQEDVFPRLQADAFDLVFIDSGKETVDEVRAQARDALKLVRRGGTIAFHDHGRFAAVDEALHAELGAPTRVVDTLAVYERAED